MEKTNNIKYIKTIWNEKDVNANELGTYIYFSEINMDNKTENKRVVYYPNGLIKAANEFGGYLGEEISHGNIFKESLLEELNDGPDLETSEISREEFDLEWEKAVSQPGFSIKVSNL